MMYTLQNIDNNNIVVANFIVKFTLFLLLTFLFNSNSQYYIIYYTRVNSYTILWFQSLK